MPKGMFLPLLFLTVIVMRGQENYYSVEEVTEDWQVYTQFQKLELISFANFLYSERFYDRSLLSYFQYLYRFPGDSLEPVVYYYIARCYEDSDNPGLAAIYYQRVLEISDSTSISHQAAKYREIYLNLMQEDIQLVIDETEFTQDPYLLIFRGYAFFQKLDWKSSRQAFLAAEERFQHEHYSELLAPIFQALDDAKDVPLKKRWFSAMTAVVPGVGQAYINQWNSAAGTIVSTVLLFTVGYQAIMQIDQKFHYQEHVGNYIPHSGAVISNSNDYIRSRQNKVPAEINLKRPGYKLIIPPIAVGLGIYFGSVWKTIHDVDNANLRLVQLYVSSIMNESHVSRFMDFPEPEFSTKY